MDEHSTRAKTHKILLFCCFDDRFFIDKIREDVCEQLGVRWNEDVGVIPQTLPGGNYRAELDPIMDIALRAAMHKGWSLDAIVLARHARNDCAACAIGARVDREQAIRDLLGFLRKYELGHVPIYTGKVSTETSRFVSFHVGTEEWLPADKLPPVLPLLAASSTK